MSPTPHFYPLSSTAPVILMFLKAFAALAVIGGLFGTLAVGSKFEAYDAGLFIPFEDLKALSSRDFTTLAHPLFPNTNVRIKKSTDFCDGSVNAYTGYIDNGARHMFFYFFESRNNPATDDMIFWTDGGPGCSSALGLFMELGPCRVTSANATTFNPYSWNENANVFFVDQPIGVGFSYADYGEYVMTTEDAATDIAAFMAIFFEHFTQFKGRPLHMTGESYGGHYVPAFAAHVYDQNAQLIAAGATPINLTSIMIGNGCTDYPGMLDSYYEVECAKHPVQSLSFCMSMKKAMPRCQKWLKESCLDIFDTVSCSAAMTFCTTNLVAPFFVTGYNPYDITKLCDGTIETTLCYPIIQTIQSYLDQPAIRQQIGVDPAVTANFTACSSTVGALFTAAVDSAFPSQNYIELLLARGVKTLIYVGDNDWICNSVGNEKMTLNLDWANHDDFGSQPLKEWSVNGKAAGQTRSSGPLTYTTIYGAGHLTPLDQPEVSLEMVKRWISGKGLL
ncbi:hypothetical protein EIP91_001811 [Steccherinum ochraceum]|uniref:Carboxypeptidase n=1 Tax=Steccherinum ochraceum TaxID=92696 RepID=A0A4R0RPK6_9APHY|nr:hypothetical protein EIP91_001811 [Steccherinum ochraceum]